MSTGEYALFVEIWKERPHACSVCGEQLPVFDIGFFSHILSKGSHPGFRLYKKNILIKCGDCHMLWENFKYNIKGDPDWDFVFKLQEDLKREYEERDLSQV